MVNQILLNGLSPEQFKELFKEAFGEIMSNPNIIAGGCIDGQEFIIDTSDRTKSKPAPKEKYLTRGQAARLLQISLPTLHQYTKAGILTSYRVGSRVRYKALEIEAALKERSYQFRKKGGANEA